MLDRDAFTDITSSFVVAFIDSRIHQVVFSKVYLTSLA
jgi:hypothetical protein